MRKHAPDPDPFRPGNCRLCGGRLVGKGDYQRHARPVCGAEMRYGERCARQIGHARDLHGAGHRSRYALDNQAAARRAA